MSEIRLSPNSVKDLPEYFVPNPRLVDIVCNVLQTDAKNKLSWLEKSFPRAVKTGRIKDDGTREEFPGIFTEPGHDLANIVNTDNYTAYSFFYAQDDESALNPTDVGRTGRYWLSRTLHWFFWFDLPDVDPLGASTDIYYLQNLKGQVYNVLNEACFPGCAQIDMGDILVFDEPQLIFEPFFRDFDYAFMQSLNWPKAALRFQMEACYYFVADYVS